MVSKIEVTPKELLKVLKEIAEKTIKGRYCNMCAEDKTKEIDDCFHAHIDEESAKRIIASHFIVDKEIDTLFK